jgi:hypothetical protein
MMKAAALFAAMFAVVQIAPGAAGERRREIIVQDESPLARRATPVISPDEAARFLAGLPVNGPLEPLTRTDAWRAHAAELDTAWQRMDVRQLGKVRVWSHGVPNASTLYYFFSGPDFLYADALFPSVSTYILCAIEPVGGIGDLGSLGEAQLAASLANLRQSLSSMLKFHYFITKDLRVDLARDRIGGTLPILYVFLARTGHTIRSVTPVSNGVRIDFGDNGGRRTLFYFPTDLSNGAGNAAFFNFCRQYRGAVALLKSASYLLHGDSFSRCRDFLLQNSSAIVQDDTGIPYRYFAPTNWTVRLYGTYSGTNGIFAKYQQPDLIDAYQHTTPAPLDFAFGYDARGDRGTLMIATKR